MELDTGRDRIQVLREFHLTSFLMPVRASENDVGKIFRFGLTANTKLPNMKRTVSTHFMPDPTKRGVQSTSKAVL
eukprot:3694053-Amphidinium_carterae.1